jgi:hypothetical protein
MKLNGKSQPLVYVDDLNILSENINIRKKNTEPLRKATKEVF